MKKLLFLLLLLPLMVRGADSLHFVSGNNANFVDWKMYETDSHINRGGNDGLTLVSGSGLNRISGLCFTNWDTLQVLNTDSVVSDSLIYWLYCSVLGVNPSSVSFYAALKPGYLYEGTGDGSTQVGSLDERCWYHATNGTDSNWVKICADSANDAATPNRTDGTGADRKATATATTSITSTGSFKRFFVPGPTVDSLQYGLLTFYGYIVRTTATNALLFSSSENATAGERPIMSWFYHTVQANPPAASPKLIPILRKPEGD